MWLNRDHCRVIDATREHVVQSTVQRITATVQDETSITAVRVHHPQATITIAFHETGAHRRACTDDPDVRDPVPAVLSVGAVKLILREPGGPVDQYLTAEERHARAAVIRLEHASLTRLFDQSGPTFARY